MAQPRVRKAVADEKPSTEQSIEQLAALLAKVVETQEKQEKLLVEVARRQERLWIKVM